MYYRPLSRIIPDIKWLLAALHNTLGPYHSNKEAMDDWRLAFATKESNECRKYQKLSSYLLKQRFGII